MLYKIENYMAEGLSQKVQSIFEIKIKEDKICKAFESMALRMDSLQNKIEKASLKQATCKFNCEEIDPKKVMEHLVFNSIHPLQEKLADHEQILNNMQFNHQNLSHNMGQQFKEASTQLEEFQQSLRSKMILDQARAKTNVEENKLRLEQSQSLFSQFTVEGARKDRDFQIKINNVWDVIKDIRKDVDDLDPKHCKKSVGFKRTERRDSESFDSQMVHNKFKKIVKKAVLKDKDEVSILMKSNEHQEKTVQYAGILLKIEGIQNQFKEFTRASGKESQKVLVSKQTIEYEFSSNSIPENKDSFNPEKKKQKSRFGRSSIATEQYSRQSKERQQMDNMAAEVKKLNQKVSDIKYKYTLLQQNYEIILTKIPRVYQIEASVQAKLQEMQKFKIDLVTINQIKMRFRKIQAAYQQQEGKYVPKQVYQKQMKSIKDHIKQVQLFSSKLAKQDEIKQAFEFIETKIKEIVIVLTDKFEVDREGAINKIQQVKCLTCNKEMEQNNYANRISLSSPTSKTIKMRNTRTTYKRVRTEDGC